MGCSSSKRIDARVDVYRPPPSSLAVFDINSIEEPWVVISDPALVKIQDDGGYDAGVVANPRVPLPILEKLNKIDSADAPQSWEDVNKSLSLLQLDRTLSTAAPPKVQVPAAEEAKPRDVPSPKPKPQRKRKSFSFHTLEELDTKVNSTGSKTPLKKTELMQSISKIDRKTPSEPSRAEPMALERVRSVRENLFILRDKMEREKEGKSAAPKWDPLGDFQYKCPPRGEDRLVVYTTSLGGVRRTYEDCNRARLVLDSHGAVYDERDVALHGEFLSEIRELLGEEAAAPRVFLNGRYLGGVEELELLNDSGRFARLLRYGRVERGAGRRDCEGCGGGRFVPCMECGGSCKVILVVGDEKGRCGKCNENGLVLCPLCLLFDRSLGTSC